MTPAERAVLDAARAWYTTECADSGCSACAALEAAVHALPRPLSEQLAELRPGDVVEVGLGGKPLVADVLANLPTRQAACVEDRMHGIPFVTPWADITRIISNPEADRG